MLLKVDTSWFAKVQACLIGICMWEQHCYRLRLPFHFHFSKDFFCWGVVEERRDYLCSRTYLYMCVMVSICFKSCIYIPPLFRSCKNLCCPSLWFWSSKLKKGCVLSGYCISHGFHETNSSWSNDGEVVLDTWEVWNRTEILHSDIGWQRIVGRCPREACKREPSWRSFQD